MYLKQIHVLYVSTTFRSSVRLNTYGVMIEFSGCLRADGVDCWSENTQLEFDSLTKQYSNFPGVHTWIPGWGRTDTVEYVDPSWIAWALGNLGTYAKYFIDGLQYTISSSCDRGNFRGYRPRALYQTIEKQKCLKNEGLLYFMDVINVQTKLKPLFW